VALAARSPAKLAPLAQETGAKSFACDAAKRDDVANLFGSVSRAVGEPDVVIYNASYRQRGPLVDLDPAEVEKAIAVTAFGGFLVAQEAVRRMLPQRHGAILFTGASASVKGYAQSAPFAMGKFALRGLAQSMARELSPQGIHVAHVVIDGVIGGEYAKGKFPDFVKAKGEDGLLELDAIADAYWALHRQRRSAWTHELDLRPFKEPF
jgi:NAD(P)-dependent dehydrogenase (short-subunit alcohol dehydrogenase family)